MSGFTLENIATREETYSGAAAVMANREEIYMERLTVAEKSVVLNV